ncbi:MAG: hypothetical protein ACI89X_001679 [Planctomycetota bacterium]
MTQAAGDYQRDIGRCLVEMTARAPDLMAS